MGRWIARLVLVCALGGCDTLEVSSATQVRVENASSLSFDHVSYWAGNEQVTEPELPPGANTHYVEALNAYGYTTVEISVEGDTVRLQVIDYVGESPLSPGRYTYVLGLEGTAGNRSLTQALRKDS